MSSIYKDNTAPKMNITKVLLWTGIFLLLFIVMGSIYIFSGYSSRASEVGTKVQSLKVAADQGWTIENGQCSPGVSVDKITFYCNYSAAQKTLVGLNPVPGSYKFVVTGNSDRENAAGIDLYVDGKNSGTVTFPNSIPTQQEKVVTIQDQSTHTIKLMLSNDTGANDTIVSAVDIYYMGPPPTPIPIPTLGPEGAVKSGRYTNLFKNLGKSQAEIDQKINLAWSKLFYGQTENERVYFPVGTDMAYIYAYDSNDVRSEGMSYGMMISVQMNKQDEFNRLWKWAKTYMENKTGPQTGYFAWSLKTNGEKNSENPAPDGEEYFVTALLFADKRWGSQPTGIFNYKQEALSLLEKMKKPNGHGDYMFNPVQKQVVFTPIGNSAKHTDPSYHLPAFYEIWYQASGDQFWREVAMTSREFFKKQAHPINGIGPEYAEFDGTPFSGNANFFVDAWRTAHNVAVDYYWWRVDSWQNQYANKIQGFFAKEGVTGYGNNYELNGKKLANGHSPGLVAMNAVVSHASNNPYTMEFVQDLWNVNIDKDLLGTDPNTYKWRYYNGLLYLMGLLHVSGNFRAIGYDGVAVPTVSDSRITTPTPYYSPTVGVTNSPSRIPTATPYPTTVRVTSIISQPPTATQYISPTVTNNPPTPTRYIYPTSTPIPTLRVSTPTAIPPTNPPGVMSVRNFVLVNAQTDRDIVVMTDRMQIKQSQFPYINIRANINPETVGSVYFQLYGPQNRVITENWPVYALYGNNGSDYYSATPPKGWYTLTVIPYSKSNLTGDRGQQYSLSFEIIQ